MSSSSDAQHQRPIQLLFRSKEAVELFTLPDTSSIAATPTTHSKKGGTTLYKGKTTFHTLNPNGECAYVHNSNVGLVRCDFNNDGTDNNNNGSDPFLQDSKAIQLAKCSPRGSFLLTWERANNNNKGSNGNLKVWDAKTGSFVKGYSCKKATLATLQWTHDERYVFHLVTNEVHVYTNTFVRVGKVRCAGIVSFSLPSVKGVAANTIANEEDQNKYLFTAFVPGTKGKPARVDLLRYPDRMGRESSTVSQGDEKANVSSGPSLASKSLFNAEEVTVRWSPRADSALLLTQTAVDSTGESYYGSTHLFLLLENDNKRSGFGSAVSVPLPAEAAKGGTGTVPIVGAEWIANPQISGPVPFAVISGRMPALASLHHGVTAEPSFLFGRAHRNIADVSPHGRFMVLGGYGNLAGGMDFWDRNKGKRIPRRTVLAGVGHATYVTTKEPADLSVTSTRPVVGHQWSPDSRTYLVSTTSPRMNVENGVHIYRYDGSLVGAEKLPWENSKYQPNKLLYAEYVPAPLPSESEEKSFYYYPDRPQSPPPRGVVELKGEAAKVALAKLSSQNAHSNGKNSSGGGAVPASAYVPPAARKAAAGGGGGAYVPPGARKGDGGASRGGGNSLAERMRQEREGSAANVSGITVTKRTGPVGASSVTSSATVGGAAGEKSKSALRREKQRLAKEKAEREAAAAEERMKEEERARVEANKADPEKRAKKIKKTLKQIDDIKKKREGGAELNDDQRRKVASEEGLRKELASLGL